MVINVCLVFHVICYFDVPTALFSKYPGVGMIGNINASAEIATVLKCVVITCLIAIPFVLTAIIAPVCAVFQIYSLLISPVISPTTVKERRMTVTIIILKVVCLVCNVPYTAAWLYLSTKEQILDVINFNQYPQYHTALYQCIFKSDDFNYTWCIAKRVCKGDNDKTF